MSCGRRYGRLLQQSNVVMLGAWWQITGFCIFAAVILCGVAACRGARKAKAKARDVALAGLLALMTEADRASRLDRENAQPGDVGIARWVREGDGVDERKAIFFMQAIAPNGDACAAMMCREQTLVNGTPPAFPGFDENDHTFPSPPGPNLGSGTLQTPRFHLPSFEMDRVRSGDENSAREIQQSSFGLDDGNEETEETETDRALRQLSRRPRDHARLAAALVNLCARDPGGMSLDEIRMASLALRRAREAREYETRLEIIRRGASGYWPSGTARAGGGVGMRMPGGAIEMV